MLCIFFVTVGAAFALDAVCNETRIAGHMLQISIRRSVHHQTNNRIIKAVTLRVIKTDSTLLFNSIFFFNVMRLSTYFHFSLWFSFTSMT